MENSKTKDICLTNYEIQILYAALMAYGDKLSDIVKTIPNELSTTVLSVRAKDTWNLAEKVCLLME